MPSGGFKIKLWELGALKTRCQIYLRQQYYCASGDDGI